MEYFFFFFRKYSKEKSSLIINKFLKITLDDSKNNFKNY